MSLFSFLKDKFSKKENKEDKIEYAKGMEKSRKNFASKLQILSKKYSSVNESYFNELEEILLGADVGVELTIRIIDQVLEEAKVKKITEPVEINELLVDKMFVSYAKESQGIVNEINFVKDGPTVVLVVGVNGVGKTTSIAKLAKRYIDIGKKVLLVAADTFRAGAVEQLSIWANRLNCGIVVGEANQDPSSVAFEGARIAIKDKVDLLIIDTAGRLQTKINLMNELSKISRVLSKLIPSAPHEALLVIDATTGQNGVSQAKAFSEATKLTGVIITKMDGTSKGGIILAIRDQLGLPVRFIGFGEKMDDFKEFDLDSYLYGLCLGDDYE